MDDTNHLALVVRRLDGLQQVREADDGIQRGTDLVRHICQEHRLQTSGVVGTFRLALQLLLFLHHTRYVSYQSEALLHLSVFIIDRDVVDLVPLYLMTLMEHRTHLSHIAHGLREVGIRILEA